MGKQQGSSRWRGVTLVDPTKGPVNYREIQGFERRSVQMSDAIAQLERQAKEVRDGLDSSNSKFQELGKQISELDRQRQAVLAENIKQQGALAELEKAIVALRSGEPSKASTGETVN